MSLYCIAAHAHYVTTSLSLGVSVYQRMAINRWMQIIQAQAAKNLFALKCVIFLDFKMVTNVRF
jgi:hypothetical protein